LFSKLQALQLKPEGHVDLTKERCQKTCVQALVSCLMQSWSSSELAGLQEQISKFSIVYDATSMPRAFIAAHGQQACRSSDGWKIVIQICIAAEASTDWLLLIRQQDQLSVRDPRAAVCCSNKRRLPVMLSKPGRSSGSSCQQACNMHADLSCCPFHWYPVDDMHKVIMCLTAWSRS